MPPEPQVKTQLPSPPEILGPEARREWFRAGKLLKSAGVISSLDRSIFALYCAAWERWQTAAAEVRERGSIATTPNGYPQISPYLVIEQQAIKQLAQLGEQLGLSPASRSRIKTNGFLNAADQDPVASFRQARPPRPA